MSFITVVLAYLSDVGLWYLAFPIEFSMPSRRNKNILCGLVFMALLKNLGFSENMGMFIFILQGLLKQT